MPSQRKTFILFVLLALAGLPLGCSENKASGDADMQRRKSHLAQIYEFYMMFSKGNQRPPKQLADFKQYQGIDPVVLKALENGDYFAIWGVSLSKDPGAVIAYEKDAPTKGGLVLLADSAVKKMTAQEVLAATKH
jgi:hypothetical protein